MGTRPTKHTPSHPISTGVESLRAEVGRWSGVGGGRRMSEVNGIGWGLKTT